MGGVEVGGLGADALSPESVMIVMQANTTAAIIAAGSEWISDEHRRPKIQRARPLTDRSSSCVPLGLLNFSLEISNRDGELVVDFLFGCK